MQKILKRLELIKTAIALEDEEIIELQIIKLTKLDIDTEVKKILNFLDESDYVSAEVEIQNYISKYNGIVIYEDKETQGLKLELKVLEKKLQEMSEKKNEYLNDITEFNTEYNLHLGKLIQEILKLKEELLHKKVKIKQEIFEETKEAYEYLKQKVGDLEEELEELDEFDDDYDEIFEEIQIQKEELNQKRKETKEAKEALEDDETFQEYEEVKEDYEEFSREYKEVISKERFELNEEEEKALKQLFRKASRLCHPDIVTDELKAQAHEIMARLNDAYAQKDLQTVQNILDSLENGIVFEIASDKINNVAVLKAKIADIREKIDEVDSELKEMQEDEIFQTLQEIDDWDAYFENLKQAFNVEYEKLEEALLETNSQKSLLMPFTNLREFPFFNGYMSIEAYYDAGTDDIQWDTMAVQTNEGKYRIGVPIIVKNDLDLMHCEDWMLVVTLGYFRKQGYNSTLVPKGGEIPEGYYSKKSKLYRKYRPQHVARYDGV